MPSNIFRKQEKNLRMVTKKCANRNQRVEYVVETPPQQTQDEICQTSAYSTERGKKNCLLEK